MAEKIIIKYNNFSKIAEKLPDIADSLVRKAAFDVEAHAKSQLWKGHGVDTGRLKNSISCEFPSRAKAIVAPHTHYAHFVEFGTRRMRAIPYMRPAVEKVAPEFIKACQSLEERLK
ncbi:MAG: HK97 gp10 family phage protein [Candidatus Methanomethylicaceae archaeon]